MSHTQLVLPGFINSLRLISLLSTNPARILGCSGGTLREGSPADVVIIDPEESWVIGQKGFLSKAENTPFAGMKVKGRVCMTIVGGNIVYDGKNVVCGKE